MTKFYSNYQSPRETKDETSRKISDTIEDADAQTTMKKKTNQLHQLPPHKIRVKKLSKSSTPSCTGGGMVVEHEKEKGVQQQVVTELQLANASRLLLPYSNSMDPRLPDKIDLPKLALDQLSNSSSNNSPRNFILSPRSQKSLFTAAQSPLATGEGNKMQ